MKTNIAQMLGNLRNEMKLSQREVANALGVSQALLSHYENDAREPKLDFVVKACDYFNVSADFILGRSHERNGISPQTINKVREYIIELIDRNNYEADLLTELNRLFGG